MADIRLRPCWYVILRLWFCPKLTSTIARAPNGYYKGAPETEKGKKKKKTEKAKEWHEGPPRVGTFSMRATRFRLRTGCLSWEKKDGTAAKNQRILDLIPAQYKDPAVNSTKGWRDLDKSEIKKIGDGAKRKPQQGPKEKRAALAKKVQDETDNHFPGFPEDREDIQHGEEDAWIYASNWQTQSVQSGNGPKDSDGSIMAPQMYNTDFQSTTLWQPPSAMYETSVDFENDPSRPNLTQPRQQSEGSLNADFDGGTHHRAQKRKRFDGDAEGRVNEGGTRLKKARIESQEPRSGRQQQRTLALNPYGPQTTSPSTAYTAAGNLSIGQEPFLAWSGDFADLVTTTQEDHSTTYNSIGVANVDSLLPDTHDSMWQHESSSRFPQSQLLPSTEATSKRKRTNSSTTEHFEGQHPTKRTKGDTIETAPIAETQTPTEPAPTLVDSIPTTTFEIPTPDFWQSDTWGTPLEPSINIPSSPYGEPWNAEPAPSLVDFIPTTTFEIPTPEYWQPDTWGTPLEPSTNMLPIDDQQGLLDPFATGPPPDLDLYTQAYGPVHFDADSPFGLYDNPYPLGDIHPPADFYSGQWEAGQAADPTEFDPGWTV